MLFYYWGLTRCLTLILCITLAWTPFGVAWADAMQAAGSDGQQTGQQLLGAFQFPVDTGSGVMTLNPGTTQESTINPSYTVSGFWHCEQYHGQYHQSVWQ